ncbi:MAG: hypothetical protein ACRDZO_16270 [Egibacteraceae bacterium]
MATDPTAIYNTGAGALELRLPRTGDSVGFAVDRLGAILSRRRRERRCPYLT